MTKTKLAPVTLGQLRKMLEQIGTVHDFKQIAVLDSKGKPVYLSFCAAVQSDRILFEQGEG
jgi:hypothetical protein